MFLKLLLGVWNISAEDLFQPLLFAL